MINFQPNKFAPYTWKTFLTKQIHILYMLNFQQQKFAPYVYGKSFSSKTNLHIK